MAWMSVVARGKYHWSDSGGGKGKARGRRIGVVTKDKCLLVWFIACFMEPKQPNERIYTRTMTKTCHPKPPMLSIGVLPPNRSLNQKVEDQPKKG